MVGYGCSPAGEQWAGEQWAGVQWAGEQGLPAMGGGMVSSQF